ncbi:MAG TPA: hypothetical protein VM433_09050 [Mycobacteriales bacterium]|nr:hypothetical protein [Mycobacteriales bacterium]
MFSLKKRTASVALVAGLALTMAACGGNDDTAAGGNGGAETTQASPEPAAQIDQLSGEQTAVVLDPSFLEGITGLGLTPGMLGGGTLDADTGTIAFPITGGNVTYFDPASGVDPYVQGIILHEGSGLSLTGANGTVVELENFEVDPEQSLLFGKVTVDGEVFAERADLFFLDGSTLNPLRPGDAPDTAVLQGTTVSLTETAANALNMVFETDALSEFFLVGVAEITVNTAA